MKMIALSLVVPRSNLSKCMREDSKTRIHYQKMNDAEEMLQILDLVNYRPIYGYHRFSSFLNLISKVADLTPFNHNKIYQLMKRINFLITIHTSKLVPEKVHLEKIIALRSTLHW